MPGIVGIAGDIDQTCGRELLAKMAASVKHRPWYQVDLWAEQGCALGRVGLGMVNTAPQPVWNEDGSLCVVMDGELYDCEDDRRALLASGCHFTGYDDAEFLLRLYEARGGCFADRLNGSFVAAVWDNTRRKLTIVTDRMGSYPVYYAHHNGRLIFAPNVHGLLNDGALSRDVDRVAIAQAFTFDHILDDRTWLAHAKLMPPASRLVYTPDALEIRPYYQLRYAQTYPLKSEQDYIEGFVHHLRRAVRRQARRELPAGLLLSGGLDSRVVAAAMHDEATAAPLHTFTWGVPGCDDARFAADVAKKIGSRHHFFELPPDYLMAQAEQGVRLTNGSNCVHYHALATLERAAQHARVIYKGVLGDAMMGTALTRHFWADYAPDAQADFHFHAHQIRGVLLFTPQEQASLFSAEFHQEVGDAVMASYRAGMAASGASQVADQRIYFDLRQRIQRMTWNGVELVRSQAMVRIPYADNDLVEFSLHTPPGFRFERYLMKKALIEHYVTLAQIPFTDSGLPLTLCARDLTVRARRFLAWHLHKAGLRKSPHIPARPYARYDAWFRNGLRDWMHDILLSQRALARGYFAPHAVRRLLNEQMAGTNHAVKLGALLALELWHQQFLD